MAFIRKCDHIFKVKYELHERYPQVTTRFLPWTDQEIQQMVQDGARAEQPTS